MTNPGHDYATYRWQSKAEDFESRYETAHANYMWALELIKRAEADRDTAAAQVERVQALCDKEKARYGDPSKIGAEFAMLMVSDVAAALSGDGETTHPEPTEGAH